MSAWYWLAGALAGGLFVYLVAVLLRVAAGSTAEPVPLDGQG